jgi:hypothetical protein
VSNYSFRELAWVWSYLKGLNSSMSAARFGNPELMASDISNVLDRFSDEGLRTLHNNKERSLLSDYEVEFISGSDYRRSSWLAYKFYNLSIVIQNEWRDGRIKESDFILMVLDVHHMSLAEKRRLLHDLIAEWSEILRLSVSYGWIDEFKNNDEFGVWLLDKANEMTRLTDVYGKANHPLDSKGRVLKFKCMMDQWEQPAAVKRSVVDKLKRQWMSRGRVKSKGRVQFNVLVRPETKVGIKALKDRDGLKSGGEVLDKLVLDAMQK